MVVSFGKDGFLPHDTEAVLGRQAALIQKNRRAQAIFTTLLPQTADI
jgi:hypothetical protein